MATTKEQAQRMIENTFKQLCKEKIMWGTEPIFNDTVDLKVNDNRMKLLILNYLQFPREIGYDLVGDRNPFNKMPSENHSKDFVEETKSFGCFGYQIDPLSFKNMYDWMNEKLPIVNSPLYIKFYYNYGVSGSNWKNTYYSARKSFNDELDRIKSNGIDLNSFLPINFYQKNKWTWGFGENLGEFISMLYFRSKGYITNPHIHVGAGRFGSKDPDMFAWRTPLQKKLIEEGIIESGTTIFELSTLCIFGKIKHNGLAVFTPDNFDESVVMEVEDTMPQNGIAQLFEGSKHDGDGYVSGQNFDKAFLVAPFLDKYYFEDKYGALTFNENGLTFNDCQKTYSDVTPKNKTIRGIDNLIKTVLMTNLSIKDLMDISKDRLSNISFHNFLSEINNDAGLEERLIDKLKQS